MTRPTSHTFIRLSLLWLGLLPAVALARKMKPSGPPALPAPPGTVRVADNLVVETGLHDQR